MDLKYSLTKENFTIEVPKRKLGELNLALNALKHKAKRMGFEQPTYKVTNEYQKDVMFEILKDNGETSFVEREVTFLTLEVSGQYPSIEGYSLAFILEKLPESKAVIPTYARDGFEVKEEFLCEDSFVCLKCNTKRNRKKVVGLTKEGDLDSSKVYLIGGECSKEFTSNKTLQYLTALSAFLNTIVDLRDNSKQSYGEVGKSFYRTRDMLAVSITFMRAFGFDEFSETKSKIEAELDGNPYGTSSPTHRESYLIVDDFLNDIAKAQLKIDSFKSNSNFKATAKGLIKEDITSIRYLGSIAYLAYMLISYLNEEITSPKEAVSQDFIDDFFKGKKAGDIVSLESVVVESVYTRDSPYGYGEVYSSTLRYKGIEIQVDSTSFRPKDNATFSLTATYKTLFTRRNGSKVMVLKNVKARSPELEGVVSSLKELKLKVSIKGKEGKEAMEKVYDFDRDAGDFCSDKCVNYINSVSMFNITDRVLFGEGDNLEKTSIALVCNLTSSKMKINMYVEKKGDFLYSYFK